ncbi:MAG TPA: DUF2269 family protein [Candidatus Polarisedimenticolia bacterium]|nr:DUF2269 family protein [Candidatus Polarisedimenticolia bacterium]
MDLLVPLLALIHVGSAMLYIAGYASTKLMTRIAVQADSEARKHLLELSGRFDFTFQIPFGTLVSLSGLALTWANGYSFTTPWVLASIVLYAGVVFIGAGIWRRRSALVRDAIAADDDARVLRLLTEPMARALGWLELALIVAVVTLMVLRPS